MASDSDRLWDQVNQVMERRRGWALEPQSSPGAPDLWCLSSDWEYQLSVGVEGDAISVFLVDDDVELLLPDPGALVEWLDANEALFFRRRDLPVETFEEIMRARLVEWRRAGY
jgi:hypothetical protein